MATWNELRDHILERFKGSSHGENAVSLSWRFEGADGMQAEGVQLMEAFDSPWLLVEADVLDEQLLGTRDAVEHNDLLVFGAVALRAGRFVVRYTLPIAQVTLSFLDQILEWVAFGAAQLRTHALGRRASNVPEWTATYAD